MANVILTNLSSLSNTAEERPYKSDIGIIKGVNTNDAPVKYLISDLNRQGKSVGRIIAVATKEAQTSYDAFCKMLDSYSAETEIKIPVPEKVSTSEDTIANTIQDVVNKISADDTVYIDTTGGFRNSSYLLMGVVRVLEYSNIKLEKAVYSKYDRSNSELNSIEDITELYRMFDLINAVNTFTSVGNSYELDEYFKDFENETIRKTIKAMNEFSDEITLCRTSKLNDVLSELNSCLEELSSVKSDSKDIILFKSLSEAIRRKFNVRNGEIEYPAVVKWCLDNKLIQQAVTVYVEKMPEYFFEKGYFSVPDDMLESVRKKNEKSKFGFCYDLFYDNIMKTKIKSDSTDVLMKLLSNLQTKSSNTASWCKTDEQVICEAIADSIDFSVFERRIGKMYYKFNIDSKKENLKKLFIVKNAIYFNGMIRSESGRNERLGDFPELRKMLKNNGNIIKSSERVFLKTISNNHKLANAIFNNNIIRYSREQLNFIENIGLGSEYILTDKLSNEELKKLFRDIFYAKTFIRNKLNHASEDENQDEESTMYFVKYGYKADEELTVKDISDMINDALNGIKL